MSQNSTGPVIKENPERDPHVGFDLRVQIFDAATGKMIRYQPYLRFSDKSKGVVYERDGKLFCENGQPADETIWGKASTMSRTRTISATTVEELQQKLDEQQKKIDEMMERATAPAPASTSQTTKSQANIGSQNRTA